MKCPRCENENYYFSPISGHNCPNEDCCYHEKETSSTKSVDENKIYFKNSLNTDPKYKNLPESFWEGFALKWTKMMEKVKKEYPDINFN